MNYAALSAALTLLAVLTVFPRRGRALHRLTTPSRSSTSAAYLARSARRRLLPLTFATIVALGTGLSLGPPAVVTTLAVAAILTVVLAQRAKSRHQAQTTRKRSQIIEACDILAADLTAGRPPQAAIATVGQAIDGPLATLFAELEHRLDLGTDPIDAWSVLRAEPTCAPFARAVQRALRSGAPLAKTLESQSTDLRQSRRWTAEEQSRAVETRSVLPLGLCFLPAFVLLGVVPTIATTFTNVFTDLSP